MSWQFFVVVGLSGVVAVLCCLALSRHHEPIGDRLFFGALACAAILLIFLVHHGMTGEARPRPVEAATPPSVVGTRPPQEPPAMASTPVTLIFVVLLSVTWKELPADGAEYSWSRLHTLPDRQWDSFEACENERVAEVKRWERTAQYVARRVANTTGNKTLVGEVVGQCIGYSSEDTIPTDVPSDPEE